MPGGVELKETLESKSESVEPDPSVSFFVVVDFFRCSPPLWTASEHFGSLYFGISKSHPAQHHRSQPFWTFKTCDSDAICYVYPKDCSLNCDVIYAVEVWEIQSLCTARWSSEHQKH
ncbi:hypothetical protein L3Y34_000467 [Caenorhabditis briggsae]|uniref:Uncharacterized protein n=1 Tax=Caenorhabditis briggsae TaxID=6238 RepID=A0AAE9IME5_CAEBR|nr:hypothetical protein L3Y34_000467 [Caenorhabditis briggsae]